MNINFCTAFEDRWSWRRLAGVRTFLRQFCLPLRQKWSYVREGNAAHQTRQSDLRLVPID